MSATVSSPTRLIKVKELADMIGLAVPSTWRWVAQGKLPPPLYVAPHCPRWKLADIERFIEQKAQDGAEG